MFRIEKIEMIYLLEDLLLEYIYHENKQLKLFLQLKNNHQHKHNLKEDFICDIN
jgi:hypothetical protein